MKSPDLLFKKGKACFTGAMLTLCLLVGSFGAWSQSLVPELTFTNPRLQTGPGSAAAGENNAVYIFSNVGYGIDALVAITKRSSADVHLTSPDWNGSSDTTTDIDNAWRPRVAFRNGQAPAHSRWWMEFSISFVSHGDHSKAVQVNQFQVTGLQAGGDGKYLREFQTYYQPRPADQGRNGSVQTAYVKGWRESPRTMQTTVCRHTSRMLVRVGAETGAGSSMAADRAYAFSFRSLYFDVPEVKAAPVLMLASNDRNSMYQPEWAAGRRND